MDERVLLVELTEQGERLRDQAMGIPAQLNACLHIEPSEVKALYDMLYKLLGTIE